MDVWRRDLEPQSMEDLEFVIENVIYDWDYQQLSNRMNWKFIKRHLDKNWNWDLIKDRFIQERKFRDLEEIIKTIDYQWNWPELSFYQFSFEFVKLNKDKPWNWLRLINNNNVDYNYIISNCPFDIGETLDHLLTQHLQFIHSFEHFIIDHPHRIMLLNSISPPILYKNLTGNIIYNIDYPWNWELISKHKCVSKELIKKMMDKPWNPDLLCKNLLKGKDYEYDKLSKLNRNLNILTRLSTYFKMEMTRTIYFNLYELYNLYSKE